MKLIAVNREPDSKQLRQFGCAGCVALPGLAWFWNSPPSVLAVAGLAGLLMALAAALKPSWLKPVFVGLSLLTVPIGLVVSELALWTMYAGVFLPIGLVFRLIRRDSLQLQTVTTDSYWRPKAQPRGAASYYRQW